MARPRFKPTPEQRKWVEAMSGYGVLETDIARTLGESGIDPKTLRKHFRRELDIGGTKANVNVAQSLYRAATSGQHPGAAMFWLKCRAGWRETSILRHTGLAATPRRPDFTQLSVEELRQLRVIAVKTIPGE